MTSPGKGFISLALYDKDNVLVRSLLYAKSVTAGPVKVDWDGATDMGKPAPVGSYTVKGIFFDSQPSVNIVMEVGKSGNPPWRTLSGTGDWGGNLGAPASISASGKAVIFAYGCVEDNQITGIQQMDGDGNIALRYFSFYPWDSRLASAMDGSNYYLGIYHSGTKTTEIAQYSIGQPHGKIITVLPAVPKPVLSETRWHGLLTGSMEGMALTKDTIYASVANNDALYIVDRATGTLRKTVTIASPHGLAVVGNSLLAVSGTKVVRLSLDGVVAGDLVPDGILTAPNAIAADSSGNLYVGDSGANGVAGPGASLGTRQVYVFSPGGKLISKIGKPGGTPQEGEFDETGLGIITSLCVGPGASGTGEALWVNDIATGFPRTSRWSLDGHLRRQWFSRKLSLYSDSFNPANPKELIVANGPFADEPGISAYHLDFAAKTWTPAWHYDNSWADMYQEDVFLSFTHGGNPYNKARSADSRWPVFGYESRHFVTYQGRSYFMDESGNGDGAVFSYSANAKPKPVALVCYHHCQKIGDKFESFYDQGPNNWLTWADRNKDGKMAANEVTYTASPAMLATTIRVNEAHLDDHMNVVMKRFVNDHGSISLVDSILPLKEMLPGGVPVYDWSQLKDLVKLQVPDLTGGDDWKKIRLYSMPIPTETTYSYYSMVEPQFDATSSLDGKTLRLPGIDGEGWWASRDWRTKIARFDKTTVQMLVGSGATRARQSRARPNVPSVLACRRGRRRCLRHRYPWTGMGLESGRPIAIFGHLFHDFGAGIEDDQVLYGEIQATSVFTDPA